MENFGNFMSKNTFFVKSKQKKQEYFSNGSKKPLK